MTIDTSENIVRIIIVTVMLNHISWASPGGGGGCALGANAPPSEKKHVIIMIHS